MKKLVCVVLFLVLMLSVCTAFALTTAEKDEMYNSALLELESYLEASESDTVVLTNIREQFSNVKYSYSQQFEYYTDILIKTEEGDFSWEYRFELQEIENNENFIKYLDELKSPIGSVEKLKNYAEARRAEAEGESNDAAELYGSCGGFFDSSERRKNIVRDAFETVYQQGIAFMNENRFEEAHNCFMQCPGYEKSDNYAAFIVAELGYDPAICNGKHQNTETVTEAATCVSEGMVTITCTVCGKTEIKPTEKNSKNHTGETEIRNAKKATCGKDGYSGDTYCLACEGKISAGKKINATGNHQWKDATYDAPKTCSVCGKTEGKPLTRAKVGDYITFGHYPQTSAGNDNTPIEWLVLDVDQISNKALVISRYALDCQPYNSESTGATWETCSLRKWLNSIFLNNAFTAKEQEGIVTETVKTRDNTEWKAYATSYTSVSGGSDTHDKVFLLSIEETMKYGGCSSFADFVNKGTEKMKVIPTKYAVAQGAYQYNGNDSIYRLNDKGCCLWWLRSPGGNSNNASRVRDNGVLSSRKMNGTYGAVRPAFWLNLDSADIY